METPCLSQAGPLVRSAPLVTDGVFQWWSLSLVVVVDDGNGFKFRLMIIELGTSHHHGVTNTLVHMSEKTWGTFHSSSAAYSPVPRLSFNI